MITCILLNQTTNQQVRPVIVRFFEAFPSPDLIQSHDIHQITEILKPTGFQNIKSSRIIKFTQAWVSGERDPKKFPGIGPYGRDAWKIFVDDQLDFIPCDKKLQLYLNQLKLRRS